MRTNPTIKFILLLIIYSAVSSLNLKAQLPSPALVGYWHNWNIAGAPYIQLDQIDSRYNVVDVAFAVPASGTDYKMEFNPVIVNQATFINQIQTLQAQGRKVIISIGGATAPVHLDNTAERDTFITTMTNIIATYGFDGMDIDLEGSSLSVTGGTISNPTDAKIINLIYATNKIMENYQVANNKKLILTMAPETAFVQGGQSAFGGIWGAYLPYIDAMRDSLDMLHVQLYNSGSMFGIDNNIYTQGTADFIVAMVEAVIVGFSTSGGAFAGIPANKVGVGLPACLSAAGGGYTDTNQVIAAVRYLRGIGPKPGAYTLNNLSGYPNLGCMMTWSVNWDAATACNGTYQYANTFQTIFTPIALSVLDHQFAAYKKKQHVLLEWEVEEGQTKIDYFDIERSSDGVRFKTIEKIMAVSASFQHLYSTLDKQPVQGQNYYRIGINYKDGTKRYSVIKNVLFSTDNQNIRLYPNPVKDYLKIVMDMERKGVLYINDISGRLVYTRQLEQRKEIQLPLSELRNGLYFIQLYSDNMLLHSTSFSKAD